MAGPADIAAMKLAAVTNRGSRKDFVDLFFLLREFELAEMLEFYERKYPEHDVFPVLKSLVYFEDAEGEPELVMVEAVDWEVVKERMRKIVREAG